MTARRHYTTARTRRHTQGVVLIEALIACSVILILFAGVWFFHDLFDRKGDTLRAARFQAWQATFPGCDRQLTGRDTLTVTVPTPLHLGRGEDDEAPRPQEVTVTSTADMMCNEEARLNTDAFAALEWALESGVPEIGQPIGELFDELL